MEEFLMGLLGTVAQYSDLYTVTDSTQSTFSPVFGVVYLAIIVFAVVVVWKLYKKAGRPGWASIVPFYNTWVLCEIAGRPGWWMFLELVPIVNIVVTIIIAMDLAKKFGKSSAFGVVGLWLFSLIGYAILAFGDAKYEAVDATAAPTAPQIPVAPQAPAESPVSMPVDQQPTPVAPPTVPAEPTQVPTSTPEQQTPSDQTPTPPQQPPLVQ
jgi:hypothetical protein